MSNKLVRLLKRTTVAPLTDSLALFIEAEAASLEMDIEIVGAAHYKPLVDKDTQMPRHKDLEAKDD